MPMRLFGFTVITASRKIVSTHGALEKYRFQPVMNKEKTGRVAERIDALKPFRFIRFRSDRKPPGKVIPGSVAL